MIAGGTEVIVGVADDHMFGPLVVFGLGGVAADVLADYAARLTPLTDTDADKLIGSIRSAPLLLGHRGSARPEGQPADLVALRDLLLRVSRLADDLPEVTELDLNPVIARPDGVFVVDARIKVTALPAAGPVPAQAALTRPAVRGASTTARSEKLVPKVGTMVPEPGDSLHYRAPSAGVQARVYQLCPVPAWRPR